MKDIKKSYPILLVDEEDVQKDIYNHATERFDVPIR